MTNSTTLYHLSPTFSFLRDTDTRVEETDYEVDALVRSGDYFVTLATILDQLGGGIKDYHVRSNIEELVSELIYLQDNYQITKAKKD